ncbi:MAG: hypothetical protein BACD_02588 [Bacteroides rodentium]
MHAYLLYFIGITIASVLSVSAFAMDVVAITDKNHPINHIPAHMRVIRLDAPETILGEVSAGLPADHERASLIAKERLNDSLHRQLRDALQDVADAWMLDVQKIPAVVVDRRYVVYGEVDVVKALDIIKQYREQNREQEVRP